MLSLVELRDQQPEGWTLNFSSLSGRCPSALKDSSENRLEYRLQAEASGCETGRLKAVLQTFSLVSGRRPATMENLSPRGRLKCFSRDLLSE